MIPNATIKRDEMTMSNKAYIHEKSGNLVSPRCKMAWPALFKPAKLKGQSDDQAKYQVTCLIPKDADIAVLKTAAAEAAADKFKAKGGIRSPFRKTDENEKLAAAGLADDFPYYITARSKDRPGVVGPNGKTVEDPEQVYSGRWARISCQAFAYDQSGNKGVSFGLQNVQLLDQDEPLNIGGARVSAEAEFEPAEGVSGDDTKSSDNLFD